MGLIFKEYKTELNIIKGIQDSGKSTTAACVHNKIIEQGAQLKAMRLYADNIMKRIFILLITLLIVSAINAQNIKTYSGEMSKPEWLADLIKKTNYIYNYKGYYSYYEDAEENRIIHGSFNITKYDRMTDEKVTISGNYQRGKRDGQWVERTYYKGKVTCTYKFQYKNGVLHGPYSYNDDHGFSTICTFNNGILSGTYIRTYTYFSNFSTKGKVDAEGRPHGEWTTIKRGGGWAPEDISELYYKGCLLYRRRNDLSLGKITFEDQISPNILTPNDISKIHDTIINGANFVDVGGVICTIAKDPISDFNKSHIHDIYPNIENWAVKFDTTTYHSFIIKCQKQKQDSIRKAEQQAEQQRQDSIRIAEQVRQKRLRVARDSVRRADEERRRIEQQDNEDIERMEYMVYYMVMKHEENRWRKLIKGIKDGNYLVLTTKNGNNFRDIFKEEFFTTRSGKVIDQWRIRSSYGVRVAMNQTGNLLIVYDSLKRIPFILAYIDSNSEITYYTIKKRIGKKIKQ